MAFHILANSTVADNSDINDNNYFFGGTRLPYTQTANGTLTAVDSTYDLGSSAATWDTAYVNDVYNTSLTTGDRSILHYIAGETFIDTATSIEFTGLNGDNYENLIILMYSIAEPNTSTEIGMKLNLDSASNYGHQLIYGQSTIVGAQRSQNQASWVVNFPGSVNSGTAEGKSFTKMSLFAKAGRERTALSHAVLGAEITHINSIRLYGYVWSNTTDTITNIKFETGSGPIKAGSTIQLWGRK